MNSVRRNTAWGAAGVLSVGIVLTALTGQPAASVQLADGSYPPTNPPTSTPPTSPPPTSAPPTSAPPTSAPPTSAPPTTPVPPPAREPLPLAVKAVKQPKLKNNKFVTLVKSSKTNEAGVVKPRVLCRPIGSSAAGEVTFCRVQITRNGGVKVKVQGYKKVRVTVTIVARPKT